MKKDGVFLNFCKFTLWNGELFCKHMNLNRNPLSSGGYSSFEYFSAFDRT